jgi:monoterpene epsilon-lactone hydrolase
MSSSENDFLKNLYLTWSDRMAANPNMTLDDMRDLFDEWEKCTKEPQGVTYKSDNVAGVNAIWALPLDADTKKVLIFTHGGGFVVGSSSSHRKLAGHVAKALKATCLVLDYRLAPESPYPAQLDDVTAVYQDLLGKGVLPENITMIGDSAGGNLAISSVLNFREKGLPLPGSVIAFSPWTDMAITGGTIESNEETDALVKRHVVEAMAGMFLGENGSPQDPLASPVYADYAGYPPLYINAGSVETLLDDSRRVKLKADEAGVDCTLSVVDGMQHVFPFLAGRETKADDEINKIARWYANL